MSEKYTWEYKIILTNILGKSDIANYCLKCYTRLIIFTFLIRSVWHTSRSASTIQVGHESIQVGNTWHDVYKVASADYWKITSICSSLAVYGNIENSWQYSKSQTVMTDEAPTRGNVLVCKFLWQGWYELTSDRTVKVDDSVLPRREMRIFPYRRDGCQLSQKA